VGTNVERLGSVTVSGELEEFATGLQFPEGPIALSDGSLLVTEIRRGTLTHVGSDGALTVVARLGGGPNGAAVGPDGSVYVCNTGGGLWHEVDGRTLPGRLTEDVTQGPGYTGGRVDRVDPTSGAVETVFTHSDGLRLRAPNEIVFDDSGGFWFSDSGKRRRRDRDITGVHYATKIDHHEYHVTEVIGGMINPNGVALSPSGDTLYVTETEAARVWSWRILGPGELEFPNPLRPRAGTLFASIADGTMIDSLAVDAEGYVAVASLGRGGITVFDPQGSEVEFIATGDPLTTNLCFGGPGRRTAFITCSSTGKVVTMRWPNAGLPLAFELDRLP
jgi:gluconolactonase